MSEKRFSYNNLLKVEMIFDEKNDRGYYVNGENCTSDDVKALVDLLNEQQDTIHSLKEENERLQKENNILNRNEDGLKECTLENEQLRKELAEETSIHANWLIRKDAYEDELHEKIKKLEEDNEQWERMSEIIFADTSLNIGKCENEKVELKRENENLRKQLECNVIHKSVCSICKHHKLEQDTLYPQWHVSRCEKGKEECSKTTVSYCEYFERDNDE